MIGSLIGARVFWKPPIVAGVVAGACAIVMGFVMRSVPTAHPTYLHWINTVLLALAVLVAVVVAQRVSRGRPPSPSLRETSKGHQRPSHPPWLRGCAAALPATGRCPGFAAILGGPLSHFASKTTRHPDPSHRGPRAA